MHFFGNIESSTLRHKIARLLGFTIIQTKRPSGSAKLRISEVHPDGERFVSEYIAKGYFKAVQCHSKEEAQEFQYYLIDQLHPFFNTLRGRWNLNNYNRFIQLYQELQDSPVIINPRNGFVPEGFGVYAFFLTKNLNDGKNA